MVGQTLTALRSQIETRADDGAYGVICGRTKGRLVPLDDLRFRDRETTAEAARFAEQYRAALRRYDPQVPCYHPIICEVPELVRSPSEGGESSRDWAFPSASARFSPRSGRIEFCHHVAGAVFETLSDGGYDAIKRAVMDVYFEAAETITSRDTLCLRLFEQMAAELDTRLSPETQAGILRDAVTQLPGSTAYDAKLWAAFGLVALDFFESYSISPPSVNLDTEERTYRVSVTDYVLSPTDTALPTLPITVDVLRRQPDNMPAVSNAARVDANTWQLIPTTASSDPVGLTAAPISENP